MFKVHTTSSIFGIKNTLPPPVFFNSAPPRSIWLQTRSVKLQPFFDHLKFALKIILNVQQSMEDFSHTDRSKPPKKNSKSPKNRINRCSKSFLIFFSHFLNNYLVQKKSLIYYEKRPLEAKSLMRSQKSRLAIF